MMMNIFSKANSSEKSMADIYKDEKQFLLSENSVSAYFPLNIYSEKRKKVLEETFKEKFSEDEEIVYNLDFYEYDEEDYQNSWKKYLFVEKVSEKFVVKPTWREYEKQDDELVIEYMATTNKKTIINLTSHGFFSLTGIGNPTPTIDTLECEINANYYLPIDETSIPTGEIRFVEGTPFDFRTPKAVGKDIDADHEQIKNGAGYDHCFVLNKKEEGELSFAAKIKEPVSGQNGDLRDGVTD